MNNQQEITRWGIGPEFALSSISYGFFTALLTAFISLFKIEFVPYPILLIIGIILILMGIPFFIIAIKSLHHAYNRNSIITTGVYGICRHPIYGAWIFFIVPGIALIAKSWLALTTPIAMYILLKILVKKEEKYLEERFGEQYIQYKTKTPFVLPIGWIKNKSITTYSTGL
jgi:protein-S-isoprenylcysteine O-methyltransferase Ste14